MSRAPTTTFKGNVTPDGAMRVAQSDSGISLAEGLGIGRSFKKFSGNCFVDKNEAIVVSGVKSNERFQGLLATPQRVRVSAGGNNKDTIDGTGAQKVLVFGVTSDWLNKLEILDLAGNNESVLTDTAFYRIWRANVTQCGTFSTSGVENGNVGEINVEAEDGTFLMHCPAGTSQSQTSLATIQIGDQGYITDIELSASKACTFRFYIRPNARNLSQPARCLQVWHGVDNPVYLPMDKAYLNVPGGGECWITAEREGAGKACVSCAYTTLLVPTV